MIKDLTDINYVQGLQSDLRACFDNPSGKNVMEFLEYTCGWYHSIFSPQGKDMILINDGKRQVVSTIKTLLNCEPGQIVTLAKMREGKE